MALFIRTAKLDPWCPQCEVRMSYGLPLCSSISCQRNHGYRPSRVNITAQGLSIPDTCLSPTHLSVRRGRATTTHYTRHQVSLMVSRNITLVPSLGLHTGTACEAGLSAGMRREPVPPQRRKRKKETWTRVSEPLIAVLGINIISGWDIFSPIRQALPGCWPPMLNVPVSRHPQP